MCSVSSTTFSNFVVPFGGVFVINEKVDMTISNIFVYNISTISRYQYFSTYYGCPLLIFIGNNFYFSKVCCSSLATQYSSLIFTYTDNSVNSHLNESSFSSSSSSYCNININLGKCLSDGINCSDLKATSGMATIHFGCSPISYKHLNFIAFNNSGDGTFGHSCSSSPEQYCINFVLINNIASIGVLYFSTISHRLVNGYIKGNDKSCVNPGSSAKLMLEQCYYDSLSGSFSSQNSRTEYEYVIKSNIWRCKASNIIIVTKRSTSCANNPVLALLIIIHIT